MRIILLLLLLIGLCCCCPKTCNCTSKTLSCSICLSHFFQLYNTTLSKCQCLAQFSSYKGGGDYCCPESCEKCYQKGCATCEANANVVWNETLKFYDCVCTQNFYRVKSTCYCMSEIDPENYYYDMTTQKCYKCPKNCICDSGGCVSCQNSQNRTVKYSDIDYRICPCQGMLIDVDGVCSCYQGCECSDNYVDDCKDQSNRFLNYSDWNCIVPYVQISNYCQCVDPYGVTEILGQTQCVCKSKINYTSYYQIDSKCQKCSESCTCDNRGCVICNNPLWRQQNFKCYCSYGSIEINGQCACVDPFYTLETNGGNCSCLSQQYPLQYFEESTQKICYVCPKQCICSETGCNSCSFDSLRKISLLPDGKNGCGCIDNANEIQSQCYCGQEYYYQEATRSCKCINARRPSIAYIFRNICTLCPLYCICDRDGCFYCRNSAIRAIIYINGHFQCPCRNSLQDKDQRCVCPTGSQFDHTTRKCQCIDPYYTVQIDNTQDTKCVCKSQIDPKHYYIDPVTMICSKCPVGCSCDPSGCFDCDPLTMRFVQTQLRQTIGKYSRCPCVQNSFYINSVCTICASNSYYNGISCTPCLECLTCDRYGCLSCNQNMTLIDLMCVCDNQNLTNINGHCLCAKGQYLDIFLSTQNSQICLSCPKNCYTCVVYINYVLCTSCAINGTFRQDISESNCPCMDGYTQSPIKTPYCCPNTCEQCIGNQCLTCPLYTFRTVFQGNCICQQPYSDRGSITCGCSSSAYYYNQSCLKCPQKCQRCYYDYTELTPKCYVCSSKNNRNVSNPTCPCLSGFIETIPSSYFCYALYCQNNQPYCSFCQGGRILNESGLCVCPMKSFQFLSVCLPCYIPGCQRCDSKHTCSWCDQQSGYYLVGSTCIGVTTDNKIISQLQTALILQVKLNQSLNVPLTSYQKVTATVYRIAKANSTQILDFAQLKIIYIAENQTVVTFLLTNPTQQFTNVIISLLVNNPDQQHKPKTINVKIDKLLSSSMLQDLDAISFKYVVALVSFFMIVACIINLRGYKHNQIMFYMQTMSFLGYYLGGARFSTSQFLFNMKSSYFKFTEGLLYKTIPTFYFESSEGNFRWLTGDSNMIRVIDLPIFIFLIILGLYIITQVLYLYFVVKLNINTRFIKYKKWFYRLFQFFFKSLMYPIIFFSINTLLNANCDVFMNISFKYISIAVSCLFLVFFLTFVLVIYYHGQTSRLYSIQLLCELIIDYAASISLIKTLQYQVVWLPVFIIIIIAKDLTYFIIRQKLANEQDWFLKLQLAVIIVQIVPLFMVYFDYQYPIVISIFVSVALQSVVQLVVIWRIDILAHYDKLKISIGEDVESVSVIMP